MPRTITLEAGSREVRDERDNTRSTERLKMARERNLLLRLVLDVLCVAVVGFPILVFFVAGKPYKRGFFCNDESIRYPLVKDTISNTMLYVIGMCSPIIVVTIGEYLNRKKEDRHYVIYERRVPPLIHLLYKQIGVFLFGSCISQLLTDIGKYSTGRLRPHFLDACKPDVIESECSPNEYIYIEDYKCNNTDIFIVREARLSFPSGHASFSSYSMIYIVIYLQYQMRCETNKLLKPFLQVLALLTTWYISLSRISDYKHHWSDVLFGGILGTLVAIIVMRFVSDLPKRQSMYKKYSLSHPSNTQLTNYNSCDKDMEEGNPPS